ncbi:hypothetical protein V1J52_23350 [Streptomyces sp. TRM 70351]|uniref:hypothetical protein n=1 Tax=Streptomyces sp. TRM 70351 TaxID=3116552 RepID=UPI002E7B2A99|nr:hypothetical protein [Streptomyces sp. TRM 70351]MEE1931080.1 hypothetical protein [Streptomyces sp. TRM 70351]
MAVSLTHGSTTVLYHETGGLLLRAGLVPLGDGRALAFQLGYTGHGRITLDVAAPGGPPAPVTLHGGESAAAADWTSVTPLPAGAPVDLTCTVLGQPGDDDPLRGRLDCRVTGTPARLTASTTMGICLDAVPALP